ncbi:MAG: hypothetical protein WCS52_07960 [bacterium]
MTINNIRIHLIERDAGITKVDGQVWESGFWVISESNAQKLINGSIFFHKKLKEPSFFGGIIQNYRIQEDGAHSGSVIFKFEYQADHRNIKAENRGWSNEIKIVLDK